MQEEVETQGVKSVPSFHPVSLTQKPLTVHVS